MNDKIFLDITDIDYGNNICDVAAIIDEIRQKDETQMIPYGDDYAEGYVIPLSAFEDYVFPSNAGDLKQICKDIFEDLDWIEREKNDAWEQMQNPGDIDDVDEDYEPPMIPDDEDEVDYTAPTPPPRVWIDGDNLYIAL